MSTDQISDVGIEENLTDKRNFESFRISVRRRMYGSIGLAVLTLLLSVVTWPVNVWMSILLVLIAASQLIAASSLLPRMGAREQPQDVGNVVVQHSWIMLSISIAAIALYPSPFFAVSTVVFVVAIAVGMAWIGVSILNIYQSVTEFDSRLTV